MSVMSAQFPEFRDRTVLVSGGGSGIGAAIVEGFARQGAKVSFLDVAEAESLELVQRLAGETAHPVSFHHTDLRDIDAVRRTVNAVVEKSGPIRVLVNNAAWDDRHEFDDVTEDYWDNNQAVNLRHVFFAAQAVVPQMRELGYGSIINMTSGAWVRGIREMQAYSTAKAAIVGFTNSLARQVGEFRIRVNALAPGMVITPRQRELWYQDESKIADGLKLQCIPEEIKVEDVARTFFAIGDQFNLDWLRTGAKSLIGDSHWQRLAVFAIIDDLNTHQRDLTLAVLGNDLGLTGIEAIDGWKAGRQATLSRTESLFTDLRQTTKLELAMLAVANRALRSLLS